MDKVNHFNVVDVTLVGEIRKMGETLTPPEEMAVLLDVDENILNEELSNRLSPIRRAYLAGKASTASKLREQMLEAASAGSPSAIEQALASMRLCSIG